ncbi:MAG: hypothetical protein CM15mP130_1310 [Verrucomicrobiota bacterium]|nr:MAG: hypothetical protein CM15mP130_1310 [Verrucomicrobiota bacterium]
MTARMNLLTMSIKRIEELLGGTQFDGQALDGSGKVREGTFVLPAPLLTLTKNRITSWTH